MTNAEFVSEVPSVLKRQVLTMMAAYGFMELTNDTDAVDSRRALNAMIVGLGNGDVQLGTSIVGAIVGEQVDKLPG